MLVQDFLSHSASCRPEKIALICDQQRLTYATLEAMTNRLAHALIEHGIKRGDRVVICLPNCVEMVVSIFAILKAGGTFVALNHTTRQQKLTYILNHCQASALIIEGRRAEVTTPQFLADVPSLQFRVLCGKKPRSDLDDRCLDFAALQESHAAHPPPRVAIDLDLACLIYTSGSTGEPKGVMSDHSNIVFAATSITTYLQNVEEDVILNVLPLSFGYGLYQPFMTCQFGGTLVLERSFAFPITVLQRMEQERVTGFPGVPTIFAIMLEMDLTTYDLSSLRYLTNAAAALPSNHIQALRCRLPSATFFSMYGQTEIARGLYLPPDQLDRRPDSVGIAIPGTEVWLEDDQGNRPEPGETGELVVRGRHVMRGYWNAPDLTAQRYRPGPLPGERICYTGDLFRMDAEGFLYFVSRKEDIIKSRGEKVAPREIENLLYTLPGVLAAAVIGVPDPILGQAIKAFVVTNDPALTEMAIIAHCRMHLEDFMVPKSVEFRDELPTTDSGKITKVGLK